MYNVEKIVNRFYNINNSFFLNYKMLSEVSSKLKKNEYSIYYPYSDSEKNIIYRFEIPKVLLYEIKSGIQLRHQDILGALYSLSISDDLFGDIVIWNNRYFIYILPILENYLKSNLLKIKNSYIELELVDLDYLKDYHREYEECKLIVSSTRIDTVISSLIKVSRGKIIYMIKKKEITLNYELLKKSNYKLKENDIFSIKGIGKYKFIATINYTKTNNLVILINKYK